MAVRGAAGVPVCVPFFACRSFSGCGERKLGRLVDALAPGGDEGRDKLR